MRAGGVKPPTSTPPEGPGICDLLPDPFLYREAFRKKAHEAGEFGKANDLLVSNITDVGIPVKGQGMVLAQRKKMNGAFDDLAQAAVRVPTAFGLKNLEQF